MTKRLGKKTKTKEKLGKTFGLIKRANEHEKRKSERKKAVKNDKPKGYKAKKLGVFLFWFIFIAILLILFANMGSSGKNKSSDVGNVNYELNKTTSPEAIEFSKDFLHQYFTWKQDGLNKDERIEKIGYYVTEDIAKVAGTISAKEWDSKLNRSDVLLKDIVDIGDNKSQLTFQIKLTFDKTEKEIEKEKESIKSNLIKQKSEEEKREKELLERKQKEKEKAESESENGEEPNETEEVEEVVPVKKDKAEIVVDDSEITKQVVSTKYVSIQLYYDEEEGRFMVYELPSFTFFDELPNVSKVASETDGLSSVMGNVAKEVTTFMQTFFDAYSNDPKEKLSYLVEDLKHKNGLNKTMEFDSFKNATVYKGKTDIEKIVTADVTFIEPETRIEFVSHYILVVKEKENGYVVTHINDKKYIDQLKNDELEAKELENGKEVDKEGLDTKIEQNESDEQEQQEQSEQQEEQSNDADSDGISDNDDKE